jgi:NitT/TauT family transport system permease protein
MRPPLYRRILSASIITGIFVLWEVLCLVFKVSDVVLPKPSKIALTLILRSPLIWPHMIQTLHTTFIGFAIGVATGLTLGILIGWSKIAYDAVYPLLVGISSIPKVAVVPIFVLYFGAGTIPAILTSAIMTIFPVVVNVATGLATTEPELEEVLRTLRATQFDVLWNIRLPRSMPYFFAALKVSVTLAFVGSVIAETVASNRGVGNMMMIAISMFDTPLLFAGLFILSAFGISSYLVFAFVESRLTGWAHRKDALVTG